MTYFRAAIGGLPWDSRAKESWTMAKINIASDFETLLPKHTDEELKQLEENCLADPDHKQMPPVLVWTHENTIIDGHNQYRLRTKHGLKCRFHRMPFQTRQDALLHAINVQIGRRNLTPSQLAMVATKFPKTERGGSRTSNTSEPTQSHQTPKHTGSKQSSKFATLKRDDLAKSLGVGRRSVEHADKVTEKGAADLVKAVNDGAVKVSDAAAIVDLPKSKQTAALSKVKKGEAETLAKAAGVTSKKKAARKKKPKEVSSAKLVDGLTRQCISPLVKGIDSVAEANSGKRTNHKIANCAINILTASFRGLREGDKKVLAEDARKIKANINRIGGLMEDES